MKQISEVYREKVINQIEVSIKAIDGIQDANADVIINDDYKSNDFGEVKRVYLKIKLPDKGKEVKPVTKISKIEVKKGKKTNSVEKEAHKDEISDELKKKIVSKLKDLLNVKENDVVISIS